eukprot:scaffold101972_cov38-Attheya_sp.AAC.1
MYDVYRERDDEEGSRCVDWIVAHCRGMGRGRKEKEFARGEFGGTGAIGGLTARITAGGVASWALAHVYGAEGRTSEGLSMLATYNGAQHYEGTGFLYMEARLAGYGARFYADRSNHLSALHLYDTSFESHS